MKNLLNGKTVQMSLEGIDGNALSLMGEFRRRAFQQGWSRSQVDVVLREARSSDYDHLLTILSCHIDDEDFGCEEEDDELA